MSEIFVEEKNGTASELPDRVDDLDRLRLENAVLLRDNLGFQEERLLVELERVRQRKAEAMQKAVAVSREIGERYHMTPGRDRIEDDGRIVRGARRE